MSARTRYAAVALAAALAAGCGGRLSSPYPLPHPAPYPVRKPLAKAQPRGPVGAGPAKDARPFTLVASGDIIPSSPDVLRTARRDAAGTGYDFRPMLTEVQPVVSRADLALCHLNAPLGPLSGPFTGYPVYQAPPQVATALKATGYDSCSTASNHVLDQGVPGVSRTLEAMDTVGLRHVGSGRDAAEGMRPAVLRAEGGAQVAQLAYTYGTDQKRRPASAPWTVNLLNVEKIITDARAARRAGADVVVVSPHWGTEYHTAPTKEQLTLARALTASQTNGRPDIDLILGTHAHTPQPYEKVNGTWVVYGLGNQLAGGMRKPEGNWGTLARFRFAPPRRAGQRWRVTRAQYIPQLTDLGPPLRVRNLARTQAHRDVRKAIRAAVLSRGAGADGLRMGG
ncbi:CapA family protein [Streptomyces natalensis]|uniref:Lipoprotein n=1 Tax=Streptomyces natalensis ATCC 27448 TaxID=1240678 RepID=A0A0D7CMQ5_9ACTN|nr:CapA family protein [Streptomyces natalensis]KIZ17346.1 lipoprotein [Streptomyces natalensis ATCC 27448]